MGWEDDPEVGDSPWDHDEEIGAAKATSPIARQNASIAKPGTLEHDPDGMAHKYARPVLEALGMAGGAALGMPLGPIGGAAGGALGYAGGDAAASLLERLIGERPPIQSIGQAGQETLKGVQTGGLMEAGGALVGKVIPKILAPFANQYEGANRTVKEMAEEKGITLSPHEILQSRPLGLAHKVLDNSLYTSGIVQREDVVKLAGLTKEWQRIRSSTGAPQRQRLAEIGTKIQDTIEKHLDKVGVHQEEVRAGLREDIMQSLGSPVTYKDLGQQTQKAITDLHQAKKGIEGLAWEHYRDLIPENARTTNPHLQAASQKILKEYKDLPSFLDEPLIAQLKNAGSSGNPAYDAAVEEIKRQGWGGKGLELQLASARNAHGEPGWNVKSLVKLRSLLSEKAAEHHSGIQQGNALKGSSDQYGKVYTELVKAADKDIEASGLGLAEPLSIARKLSGERMSLLNPKENAYVVKALNADPQTLHKLLIQPGNAAGFTQLKEAIGEHGVRPIKQAFTNQLMGEGAKGVEGLAGLRNTLDRYGLQTLSEVYKPQEIKDLYHLADKSQWMKKSPVGNPFFRELVRSNPSQVAPAILSDTNTTAKVIRAFPQMKQPLRQAFIDGVHPNEQTPFPTQLTKMLNAYPKEVQAQLFSQEELRDFHQLARIIERTKGAVKMGENPSGSGQAVITAHQMGMAMQHPLKAAPTILTSTALAKLYLSKVGRKLLMEGLVPPASAKRAAEIGTKIGAIIATDEVDRIKAKNQQQKRTPITFDEDD
jgi:hypothetical protein